MFCYYKHTLVSKLSEQLVDMALTCCTGLLKIIREGTLCQNYCADFNKLSEATVKNLFSPDLLSV